MGLTNNAKSTIYYERMDAAMQDKAKILQFVGATDTVLDVGAGTGVISLLLQTKLNMPEQIDLLEPNLQAYDRLVKLVFDKDHVFCLDFLQYAQACQKKYDVIVMSGVVHEIYSYALFDGRIKNPDIISYIMYLAGNILNCGGKLIIRDGIIDDDRCAKRVVKIAKTTARGMELAALASRYAAHFGLSMSEAQNEVCVFGSAERLINLLYTVNWGEKSFSREIMEDTAYYSLSDWKKPCGLRLQHLESYFQQGYKDYLLPFAYYCNDNGSRLKFPDSNCLVVFTKP